MFEFVHILPRIGLEQPSIFTLKMLGYFNPILGQIWTNPATGLHFLNEIFNPMSKFVHI